MCRIPDDFIDERATLTWSASCTGKACISRYLTDAIHTATPSSRFFFHVMASLTERERELTGEYPHRAGSRPPAGPQGRAQAKNDRQQDRPSQDAAGQWCAATRRGQESGRVRANSVPLAPGVLAGLRKPCITQHHLCLLHPFFHLVNFPSLRAQVFARRQAFEAFFGTCNRFLGALMQSGPTALATTSAAPSTNCPAQTRCATAARSSSDPGSAL